MNLSSLLEPLLRQFHVGVVVLDQQFSIVYLNQFICRHAGLQLADVQGKSLFKVFPEAPEAWLSRKLSTVLALQSAAFSSWEQRLYVIKLPHLRPLSHGADVMAQNCTMLPLNDATDGTAYLCLLIEDATDAYVYQSQLQQSNQQLELANRTDGLTGVLNRRYWQQQLSYEVQRADRYQHPLSLLLFDLDKFKLLNDHYGHQAGDLVLIEVARLVGTLLRDTDLFGRYGGEEFAIILPDTPLSGAITLAQRLCREVAALRLNYQQQVLTTSISIGVSEYSAGQQADELVQQADVALYTAKKAGRNQVKQFAPLV
ncbi:sensor domain-containing diguanylate cyclase [Arsukibacterium sp.]|uniref:sensor domain-containing diguanylate cyclase n=1 Tax=Arsukibacterium sp. TaxID=1977258 RepID=UPI002FD931A5